jgi:N-succinyldiaminopimelate aminotransferase
LASFGTANLVHDPSTDVLFTAGASEAAGAVVGLYEPGDEVLMLEPSCDSYVPVAAIAGAAQVPARLFRRADRWELPAGVLERAVKGRSRLLLNSPYSPSGKVLNEADLKEVAEICSLRGRR